MPPHWRKDRRRAMATAALAGLAAPPNETGEEQEEPRPRGSSPESRWQPGQSGNPGGRPTGGRALLRKRYGQDAAILYDRLEELRHAADTPADLKVQIDFFLIERLLGRAL